MASISAANSSFGAANEPSARSATRSGDPVTRFAVHLQRGKSPRASPHGSGSPSRGAAAQKATPAAALAMNPDPDAKGRRTGAGAGDDERPRLFIERAPDPIDPMTRALFSHGLQAHMAVVGAGVSPHTNDPVALAAHVSLEHLLTRLVRRIAWSGDAHTGSARLELGAGVLEGATLTIHSDHGALRVSLEVPPGVDQAEWKERIARRLGTRGLQIASLDVE